MLVETVLGTALISGNEKCDKKSLMLEAVSWIIVKSDNC